MAGLPHNRSAAFILHQIKQRPAGLHIGDNRGAGHAGEQVLGIDHQQLIAPNDPAFTVDCANPVAIPVESHSEIEVLFRDERAQIGKVCFNRWIRMMIGEIAINFSKQQMMLARQLLGHQLKRGASSAIASVPTDFEALQGRNIHSLDRFEHASDILVQDFALGRRANRRRAIAPLTRGRTLAQSDDVCAKERTPLKHHLEAIVIGGIMAASYLNAAIYVLG